MTTVNQITGVDLGYAGTTEPSIGKGTVVKSADDGHDYILALASANVAADTAVVLTEPAMTFAGGAGAWTTVAAAVSGEYSWVKKIAI